jgi:hypothetical protein
MARIIPKYPSDCPTQESNSLAWADFLEFITCFKKRIIISDFIRPLYLASDELVVSGIDSDEDEIYLKIDEIATEITRRKIETKGNYPFELDEEDYVLFINNDSKAGNIYKFLLYTTHLNMSTQRVHDTIDGALLFEHVSSIVVKNYLGANTSGGVFGTGLPGGFRTKLKSVMDAMGEGKDLRENPGTMPQDEDIDIIAWKPFFDGRKSQLIIFGQCKTGLSWWSSYRRLGVKHIIDNWFLVPPIEDPIRMFFCSRCFCSQKWDYKAKYLGIVFDRFRILCQLSSSNRLGDQHTYASVGKWVKAVEKWLKAAT